MKKKFSINFVFGICCLLLIACDPDMRFQNGCKFHSVNRYSFANSFIKLDSISAEQSQQSEFTINLIYYGNGQYGKKWYGYCYDFPEAECYNETNNAIFEEMNRRHNDTSFNRICTEDFDHMFYYRNYICFDINTIDVISTEDFDEQHPAGTSLNDLIRFVGITPMPYIKSGYVDEYDWQTGVLNEKIVNSLYSQVYSGLETVNYEEIAYTHLIDKPLNEVLPEDLMMLGGDKEIPYSNKHDGGRKLTAAFLVFTQKPTKGYKQPLTIKITAFDGIQNVKADIPVEITF